MPKRRWWGRRSRGAATVQGRLAFMVRAERMERAFKRAIAALTAAVLVGLAAGTSTGRYAATLLTFQGRGLLNRVVGAAAGPAGVRGAPPRGAVA